MVVGKMHEPQFSQSKMQLARVSYLMANVEDIIISLIDLLSMMFRLSADLRRFQSNIIHLLSMIVCFSAHLQRFKVGFRRVNLRSVHVACLLGLITTVLMHARLRIRGLAKEGRLDDSKKYVMEMLGQGIQPCAATYMPVFEAFCREQKAEEARELLEQMKAKGFGPDELIHHFSN